MNPKRVKRLKKKLSYENEIYACVFCGKEMPTGKLTIDHIIPKHKGGSNDINNLVLACRECNMDRDTAEFMQYRMWKAGVLRKKPFGARRDYHYYRELDDE